MHSISEKRAKEIIENSKGKQIAVIGDVMLDRFFWGNVSRISPEAPVPVVDIESETYHLGGAANVANNLKSLGIVAILCGVIGNDNSGKNFVEIANNSGISTLGLYEDPKRPTTVKTRIIGNSQHIARLDRETREQLPPEGEKFILDTLKSRRELAGIIFEDYNKGTISATLISRIIEFAKKKNIPMFVDPKFDNFFSYKNVTVFKPNRKEAQQALGFTLKNEEDILKGGKIILDRLGCEFVLMTLGKDGMMLFESEGQVYSVPTRARRVADVSGAGDTAIATLAASVAGGATIPEASSLANYAAGVVCEEPGIISITIQNLIKSIAGNNK
ncbi:MAG: D-glycero-beta-D-manno-heptose-7-phosphate kinase [Ignavibacteriae bacterium]|nr:D-glycero-beta-D-manno-heptose-7-phosphate kinase [Ignavibacteriota bacterium]